MIRHHVAAPLACLVAGTAAGQSSHCFHLGFENPEYVDELIEALSQADASALRQLRLGAGCLDSDRQAKLNRAAGEFFDAQPREYLRTIDFSLPQDALFFGALTIMPARVEGDVMAELEVLERRAELIDAHADLLDPKHHIDVIHYLAERIAQLVETLSAPITRPTKLADPLLGIQIDLERRELMPVSLDTISFADLARGPSWLIFGEMYSATERRTYMLISGFSFDAARGGARPARLISDKGWIQRVDDRKPREHVEALGPANVVLTSGQIPPEVAVGLCEDALRRLVHSLDFHEEDLQRVLDERIARDPRITLPWPLLEALKKSRYKVRKYRATPLG